MSILVQDSFTGADGVLSGHSPETGGAWVPYLPFTEDLALSSGVLTLQSGHAAGGDYNNTLIPQDGYVQYDYISGYTYMRLRAAADQSSCYQVILGDLGGNQIIIQKYSSGVWTNFASLTSIAAGTYKFVTQGSSLVLYFNGTVLLSAVDSSPILSSGYAAVGMANGYGEIDNFEAGDSPIVPADPTNLVAAKEDASANSGNTVNLQADFIFTPMYGDAPLAVTFTDKSAGTPASWAWEFGDGATSTSQNPSHTFSEAGIYGVRLTVNNADGSSSITKTLVVTATANTPPRDLPSIPLASFTVDVDLGIAPLTVNFTDTSTGDIASWDWDFGDGHTSASQNPSNDYAAAGTYKATLTVTDSNGQTSTATQTIIVSADTNPADNPPIATISADVYEGDAPLEVTFSSTVNTSCFYEWDFGDGDTSTEANPVHTFTVPGRYHVVLKVRNAYGETETSVDIVVLQVWINPQTGLPYYYVIDKPNDKVYMYDTTGTYVGWFGGSGSGAGKFDGPTTLTVNREV
jgi:PKD repeat protein